MTRRRWIADEVQGNRAAITGSHAAHLARVLRARPGQIFDIAAGGELREGTVQSVTSERVEFALGAALTCPPEQEIAVVLSIFKFDRMEWALEKAVELGVTSIFPLIARRTELHLTRAAGARLQRWQRIAREAAQQSRRSSVPEIHPPSRADQIPIRGGILLSETEQETTLAGALRQLPSSAPIALGFGPEGGWTAEEISQFQQAEWRPASLGPRILRAETAIVAALAIAGAVVES